MKIIGQILVLIGIIFGVIGVQSCLRDDAYAKASIIVKASVKSVEIKPMSGKAVGSIHMVLNYMRDGVADTIEHNFSTAYSNNEPLPTAKELKKSTLYVRYVPVEKRNEHSPNWTIVSKNGEFEGFYGWPQFGKMLTFILLGSLIRMFAKKSNIEQKLS